MKTPALNFEFSDQIIGNYIQVKIIKVNLDMQERVERESHRYQPLFLQQLMLCYQKIFSFEETQINRRDALRYPYKLKLVVIVEGWDSVLVQCHIDA